MENPDLVLQETGDSRLTHSRWLNVTTDKLSRLGQSRQNRQKGPSCQSFPSNMLLVAPATSGPVFATWLTTNYLNLYHWRQIPNMDNDAINLPWEVLDPYAFPPADILGKWWRSCRTTHAGELRDEGRLFVYGRSDSAFSFCNTFSAIRRILFIFGRYMQ